jgi:anti-anti-sigma regulatory factor
MTEAVSTDTVGPGDHACLTFTDAEERLDLVAAVVRDGLRAGMKVLCWTDAVSPATLTDELVARSVRPRAALRRGQLTIMPVARALLAEGGAHAGDMVKVITRELELAGREGYPGVRITADMGWATRPVAPAEELMAFEAEVARLFPAGRVCLVCEYDRDRFDAVTLAFAAKAHAKTIAARAYHDTPLLRICRQYSPGGVRIAGQLDFRHRDLVEQALSESLRLDRHPFVNLAGLEYIDGACAGLIVATAARLPGSRHVTVVCRRAVATVLDLVGAGSTPRLRVLRTHEQP